MLTGRSTPSFSASSPVTAFLPALPRRLGAIDPEAKRDDRQRRHPLHFKNTEISKRRRRHTQLRPQSVCAELACLSAAVAPFETGSAAAAHLPAGGALSEGKNKNPPLSTLKGGGEKLLRPDLETINVFHFTPYNCGASAPPTPQRQRSVVP